MAIEPDDLLSSVVLITGTEEGTFGTGFALHTEDCDVWILTCAHVMRDVGGPEHVCVDDERIEDKPPEVIACGEEGQADLAVLKVTTRPNRHIPALRSRLLGKKDLPCQIIGFTDLADGYRRAFPVDGKLGHRGVFQKPGGPRIRAWKLWLDDTKSPIEKGYSGSPIACVRTRTVFAVASHSEYEGERGYAISLENLREIWPDLPPEWVGTEMVVRNQLGGDVHGRIEDLFVDPPVDIETLRALCKAAMPPDRPHQLPANATSLDLHEWLIDRPRMSDGRVPLIEVLDALLPKVVNRTLGLRLRNARDAFAAHFGVLGSPLKSISPNFKVSVPSALLVEIWPVGAPRTRCNVQVRLFEGEGPGHSVYVREGEEALRIDDREQINNFVADLRGVIVKQGVSKERVLIEFALPLQLLSQPIDQWTDPFGDPLGVYLPVVVRSRERLHEPKLQLDWHTAWGVLRGRLAATFPGSLWWLDESARRQVRGKLQEGPCIALSFVPDAIADARKNILAYLTYAGAPIVLWPRQEHGLADIRRELDAFLQGKPLCNLPDALRDLRRHLWENERESAACYNLSLLWDDPGRHLPDSPKRDNEFLQAPI